MSMRRYLSVLLALVSALLLASSALAAEIPDWYPEDVYTFERFHNTEAPRLVDDADIFTDTEEAELSAKLATLAANHPDSDFVVFTDVSTYGESMAAYATDFFAFNGYGVGDNYDGMILFINMDESDRGWQSRGLGGKSDSLFSSDDNIDHLNETIQPYLSAGDYAEGVSVYLDEIDVLYTNGRFPRSGFMNMVIIAGSLVAGLLVAGVVVGSLKASMNTVAEATHANSYLVRGSLRLRRHADFFLYRTQSRVRREKDRGSSSRSSSSSGVSSSGGGGHF